MKELKVHTLKSKGEKVLLSAYACEPGKGSEPSAGWNWVLQMSPTYSVTVLTRKNNRESIEMALKQSGATFDAVYFDLPDWVLALKKRGLISASVYYMLWQLFVKFSVDYKCYDLVHHVTFNSFLCPGYWFSKEVKLVVGPLGGGMAVAPAYLRLFPMNGLGQRLRSFLLKVSMHLPWLKAVYANASKIICANAETHALLHAHYGDKVTMHLDAGVDGVIEKDFTTFRVASPCRFIVVGDIIARKGWKIALDSMKHLKEINKSDQVRLEFLGSGNQIDRARKLSKDYGLDEMVTWHGRVDHKDVKIIISASDVLLFPSVRDTSGYVVLEAMMAAMPVICLDHQGGREMTTNQTAIRIPVADYEVTVEAFSEAMLLLAADPRKRKEMGVAGQQRILDKFTWLKKANFMHAIYEEVLSGTTCDN